jgi:hypothetical protein
VHGYGLGVGITSFFRGEGVGVLCNRHRSACMCVTKYTKCTKGFTHFEQCNRSEFFRIF